jgi:hypothetical protein
MKACTTAGGGVMFIPEELERKNAVSYRNLLSKEKKKLPIFGKRRAQKKLRKAA